MNGENIFLLQAGERAYRIEIDRDGSVRMLEPKAIDADVRKLSDGRYSVIIGGRSFEVTAETPAVDEIYTAQVNGRLYRFRIGEEHREPLGKITTEPSRRIEILAAPMPGMVGRLAVEEGSVVEKNQALLTLEAMKMENEIRSRQAGKILKIHVKQGETVEKGQVLITVSI
jgi:biotin carboxyl carrier protein